MILYFRSDYLPVTQRTIGRIGRVTGRAIEEETHGASGDQTIADTGIGQRRIERERSVFDAASGHLSD
ncbi:hypothetical protein ACFPL7_21200 [Dongia soli]|uniref:CsbD family protein n=1 Tax=Dongia soli TaxID=600628 RepID=A0ABU5E7U0_9PROT|nr:hypothetical protein [Dongia soli]MDY0882109.1 hypothetical protein [Dongia soli]